MANPGLLQIFKVGAAFSYGFGILVYCRKTLPSLTRYLLPGGVIGLVLLNVDGIWYYTPRISLFILSIIFYFAVVLSLAAIISRPPRFLKLFTILGEESYALYAIHVALIHVFGLLSIPVSVVTAFAIEFGLRPKQILRRLRLAYSTEKDLAIEQAAQ